MSEVSTGAGLLPCPFCGGTDLAVVGDPRPQWLKWFVVLCPTVDCHTIGPARRSEAEAIAAWNQRAILKEQTP